MPFSSTTLKISFIILAASHIAIAGPVPDFLGSALSLGEADKSGGDFLLSSLGGGLNGLDLLSDNHPGNSGVGGVGGEADSGKSPSHSKGVGGSSLAGARYRQGNTVGSCSESDSINAQGGSVYGGGKGLLNVFTGNGGGGGTASKLGIRGRKNL